MTPQIERSEPPYRQVAGQLRERIARGELRPGQVVPSVRQIAAEWGVSRGTAEKALSLLQRDGVIETHRTGSVVSPRSRPGPVIVRHGNRRLSRRQWGEGHAIQDADSGNQPRTVDTVVDKAQPPDHARTALGLEDEELALRRSRTFTVNGHPVQLAVSYLPLALVSVADTHFGEISVGLGGIYARLADIGHAPATFIEKVRGRQPTTDEARDLQLPPGGWVLAITRFAYDAQGQCVEVNDMVLDATMYELVYDVDA
jgi:GntR family transcriptional regulator